MDINILFTSAGRRGYLVRYFKEAMISEGISGKTHAINSSPICPAFIDADCYAVAPLSYDSEYIPFLLDYSLKNNISLIVSLLDTDLAVLSNHKATFKEHGIEMVISDPTVVSVCNDKYETFQFLCTNGFDAPKTYCDLGILKTDLKNDRIHFPLMVKPRWGTGSISVNKANSIQELEFLYSMARETALSSFLKYESRKNAGACVVMQEYISGEEYGVDIVNDLKGNYCSSIIKRKLVMRSGETDCAITTHNECIEDLGLHVSNKLRHIGNLDVDVIVTDSGPYIIDMNARFGGGYPFSHVAGANVPRAIIRWLLHKEVPTEMISAEPGILAQKNIEIVRYSEEIKELEGKLRYN